MKNQHYDAGKQFVEGFFGKLKNVIKADPKDRLAALMGTNKPKLNIVKNARRAADIASGNG